MLSRPRCVLWTIAVFLAALLVACGGAGGGDSTGDEDQGPGGEQDNPAPAPGDGGSTASPSNLFFLHHSVGSGLVGEGEMRQAIQAFNSANGTSLAFWDHGYNDEGLRDPQGNQTGVSYQIPGDNTDVEGLFFLWTSNDDDWAASRRRILESHGVIAFKSCFPNSAIPDAEALAAYRGWYVAMRSVFDAHPDRRFVVMSTPPLHRLSTNATEAVHAREFASWLCSSAYLEGRANVACFDLFDHLAAPDDGSAAANRLRYEYEMDHSDGDSHPNAHANQTVGPLLAQFLCRVATGG